MQNIFLNLSEEKQKKLKIIWKSMSSADKEHFISQCAFFISVFGDNKLTFEMLLKFIEKVLNSESQLKNLADIGIYIINEFSNSNEEKKLRVAKIIENYRLKNSLPT